MSKDVPFRFFRKLFSDLFFHVLFDMEYNLFHRLFRKKILKIIFKHIFLLISSDFVERLLWFEASLIRSMSIPVFIQNILIKLIFT